MDCGGKAGAATPLSGGRRIIGFKLNYRACESGVALRFPPQSKTQASFYAKGRDETLAALSKDLGVPLECGLCHSAQYKTRIMWPPHVKDQELMEVFPLKKQSFLKQIMHWGEREIRLSSSALKAFGK